VNANANLGSYKNQIGSKLIFYDPMVKDGCGWLELVIHLSLRV